MADPISEGAWLEFRIETADDGVEAKKLARLLQDLSSSFYAIARSKVGKRGRPGPRTSDEDSLAAVRIVRLSPGSAIIEAEPPVLDSQSQMRFDDGPTTADEIGFEFFQAIQRLGTQGATSGPQDFVRFIHAFVSDIGEIGESVDVIYRPVNPHPETGLKAELRTRLQTHTVPELTQVEATKRVRRFTGHVYMVDVEPGRPRLRVKLPDGRNLTLSVSDEVLDQLPTALDHAVAIEAIDELEGSSVARTTATNITRLPSAGEAIVRPPKSIEELAREQQLPAEHPDYVALASAIWTTESELSEFAEYLADSRYGVSA
ncbi:MAG: hypothetical protein WEB00_05410 [Dehalococcoidia bacterium]